METQTLEKEENQEQSNHQTTTSVSSFPNEIIQDILSRLPIKPLLQFKSVSKHWLSLISNDPSFPKLHFTRSLATNRTALFITAYDTSFPQCHFLSAPLSGGGGGHVTHLMTLRNPLLCELEATQAEHLSGLVLFTSRNGIVYNNFAFIINPATRNIYKLPDPPGYVSCHWYYFFGFDEFRNEHKVLLLRLPGLNVVEFMIFSLSDYSWRKIDVGDVPVDFNGDHWCEGTKTSVCVNSVIHVMLNSPTEILAFDLRTERFEIVNIPNEGLPSESTWWYARRPIHTGKLNYPSAMKVDGLLGVLCPDRVMESNKMYVWVLQDYENRVWVRKTIAFSESWVNLNGPFPLGSGNEEEFLFYPKRLASNMMSVPVYDLKTGCFKSVKYSLGYRFLLSKTVKFNQVMSYVESIVPLEMNESGTS